MSLAHRLFGSSMFRRPASSVFTGRVNVPWNRLVFRYTEQADRDRITAKQARATEVNALYGKVPKDLPDIDFNHWRKLIKTPGIVDALEVRYKTALSKVEKFDENAQAAKDAQAETEIAAVAAKAATSKEFLDDVSAEIEWTKQYYDAPETVFAGPKLGWNAFNLKYNWPHAQIYRVNEVAFLDVFYQDDGHPSAAIRSVDLGALRKQLASGNAKALSVLQPIQEATDGISAIQRPFTKKWVRGPNFKTLFLDPNTSVFYRAYALRQLS